MVQGPRWRAGEGGRSALRGSCLFSTPQARGGVGFWWSLGPLNAADTPFPWSDLAGAGLPLDPGLKSLLKEAIALPILPIPSRWGWAPSAAPTPFHSHPAAAAKSLQSCSTLCDPMDCSPPGSSVHGIFQARVLEWGAIAFSSSLPETHGIPRARWGQGLWEALLV